MKTYRIAVYIRLSMEDLGLKSARDRSESCSVSNQRSFIHAWLGQHEEFRNAKIQEFVDDGYSGTNFERPAVKEMLALCRQGEIDCIVVKDLSRFGRNYLEETIQGAAEFFTEEFVRNLALFHAAQLLMHLEVGSICFLLSAFEKKKQVGAALGFAILLYVADLLCRMIPDLEGLKYLTPYYYSNGTDIFTGGRTQTELMGIGLLVLAAAALAAYVVYKKKDLTA